MNIKASNNDVGFQSIATVIAFEFLRNILRESLCLVAKLNMKCYVENIQSIRS